MAKTPAKVALGNYTSGLCKSTFTATPTLPSEVWATFARGSFSGLREELPAADPSENKATYSLLAITVYRLRQHLKILLPLYLCKRRFISRKNVHNFEIVILGRQTHENF